MKWIVITSLFLFSLNAYAESISTEIPCDMLSSSGYGVTPFKDDVAEYKDCPQKLRHKKSGAEYDFEQVLNDAPNPSKCMYVVKSTKVQTSAENFFCLSSN